MFKIVVSDPKSRKAWQVEKEAAPLVGMKIGEKFDGSIIGISGYSLQITGGSDKDGFPMRKDLPGAGRKKILLTKSVGFRGLGKGVRKRKSVRGNTISNDIVQINVKVVEKKEKSKPISDLLGVTPEVKSEEREKKPEVKKEEESKEEPEKEEKSREEKKKEKAKPEKKKEEK
jgi:small subunit ribosomal protein S6e